MDKSPLQISNEIQRVALPHRARQSSSSLTQKYLPNYWNEGVAYQINHQQAETLSKAAEELCKIYQHAMDHVTSSPAALKNFVITGDETIDEKARLLMAQSWRDEKHRGYVLDRFDLAWNGAGPPKLLERNFGSLGLVVASGPAQESHVHWLRKQPGLEDTSSLGNLGSSVTKAFRQVLEAAGVPKGSVVSVVVPHSTADAEVSKTGQLYQKWLRDAGYKADLQSSSQVQLDHQWAYLPGHSTAILIDTAKSMRDAPGSPPSDNPQLLQPLWTTLADHKAMLPILHELYPDHPNILPAFMGADAMPGQRRIIKRVMATSGDGATIMNADDGTHYARDRHPRDTVSDPRSSITQGFAEGVRNSADGFAVLNVFTANGQIAAVGVRESFNPIVGGAQTTFAPVIVRDPIAPQTQTRPTQNRGVDHAQIVTVARMPPEQLNRTAKKFEDLIADAVADDPAPLKTTQAKPRSKSVTQRTSHFTK